MRKVVIYHNDINRVGLTTELSEQEQNLFFGIVALIKEKQEPDERIITLEPQDISKILGKNLSNKELADLLINFKNKFFKADFTILLKEGNLIGEMRAHFFNHFIVWREYDNETGECISDTLSHINIEVNEYFEYLVNELTANFTRFELAEFIALSGKYTKTLYRLLKQYRNTGFMRMEWEEFVRIMGISKDYKQANIDQRILKPAMKELTKPRNLFDKERVPFKNLKYTKIKGKGRGRGGNVIAIEFRFDIENLEQIEINPYFDKDFIKELAKAKDNYLSKNNEWLYINNALCVDSNIVLNLYDKDIKKDFSRTYSKDEYEKDIKPFIINAANMQKVF